MNNAGIGGGEPDGRTRRTSADGHELRFAVNYLAGFLLTLELLRAGTAADVRRTAATQWDWRRGPDTSSIRQLWRGSSAGARRRRT